VVVNLVADTCQGWFLASGLIFVVGLAIVRACRSIEKGVSADTV